MGEEPKPGLQAHRGWALLPIFLMGCGVIFSPVPSIDVMRQVIDRDFYASSQLKTPDPLAPAYPEGECLVIHWHLPEEWVQHATEVVLEVLYRNHERRQLTWPVTTRDKAMRVSCMGEEFCRTHGFLTYKVSVLEQGQVLLTAPHQLWFTWIDPADQASLRE